MADKEIVASLRAAAENALSRGFAILCCEPHAKDPWAKYSPHAVNSATPDPAIALKPWIDGTEANYGVAAGKSNLSIVDCDSGLQTEAELTAWMEKNGFPATFTVRSGRTTSAGFHLYYSGAVPTTGFQIDGVVGEIRGTGSYVVGAGCIHPSGERYRVIADIDIVSLPDGLVALAASKKKLDFTPKAESGELIPEGHRWAHLQSKAGTFRNAGLSRDGIYHALKDFAATQCVNGDSYPDDKIQALADAAVEVFNASEQTGVVVFNTEKKIDTNILQLSDVACEGDWIGDLAHAVSDGTFIPLSFARTQIKTILSTAVNGLVGFPKQPDLHMKQWSMIVSAQPESGKGESWKRTAEAALANLISKASIGLPKSGYFSSGEHMVKYLASEDNGFPVSAIGTKNLIAYFDEMKALFEKGGAQNSTLFTKMISLYDREDASAGSMTHEGGEFTNISLSLTGGFTKSSFDAAIAGKGAGGDGFLSRTCLSYSGDVTHLGDWADQDTVAINAIAAKMLEKLSFLTQQYLDKRNADKSEQPDKLQWRFIPEETADAKQLREDFQKWMFKQRQIHNERHPGMGYMSRLEAHFKRDLLLRTLFSDDQVITADKTERAIEWAKHELYLREELWPVDKGNLVTRMEQTIIRALEKHEHLTKTECQRFCNVKRAETGGVGTFNLAWKNLQQGDVLLVVGKTHKGTEKMGLREGF